MEVNGDAIHGTTAGPLQKLSWGCTTQKPGKIFLHVFNWPQGELVVEGLNSDPGKASLLLPAGKQELQISKTAGKLSIKVPRNPAHTADSVIVLE
jgi:alpha-L-fucosidase